MFVFRIRFDDSIYMIQTFLYNGKNVFSFKRSFNFKENLF
jgi:hypothetical protein